MDAANKPYFVEARMAAAACAPDNKTRERLLRAAIAAAPDNMELRLQYLWAAFAAGQDAGALVAAEPILVNSGSFYGPLNAQGYNSANGREETGPGSIPTISSLKPEEATKLTMSAIHAREKRHEMDVALKLAQSAPQFYLKEETKRLETEAACERENEARAPKIHAELAQDRVVRPRLLPGMAFTPSKAARNGEDAE